MQSFILNIGEKFVPILKESNFRETGRLTPEEFVSAGDYLVFKCPTWSWCSGDRDKIKSYLPSEKQYLITKNVPVASRESMETLFSESSELKFEDFTNFQNIEFIKDDSCMEIEDTRPTVSHSNGDVIPDIDDFQDSNLLIEEDPALFVTQAPFDNLVASESCDLYITYDKYYQTPRLWLSGIDQYGSQMTPNSIMNLISRDHAHKTVTIETFPHFSQTIASVHPCKHASVMKRIIDQYLEGSREVRVDQYLILFLKFMSSIMPSVEYDNTMNME